MRVTISGTAIVAGILCSAVLLCWADEAEKEKAKEQSTPPANSAQPAPPKAADGFSPPPNAMRLTKDYDLWVDRSKKQLILDGKVVLREGLLEMFACPTRTKEHESIVAVNCKAQFVHAGLLLIGADPGKPAQFDPEYKAATGPEVDVWVLWKDKKGNHKVLAQEWIQHAKTGKQMEYPFVFAGSGFFVDESTGERHYLADGGDLICVSNFTSAMLDLPVASPQENSELAFQAYTERIPPLGTPVRLVLAPKLKETTKGAGEDSPKKQDSTKKAADSSPKETKSK